MRACGPSAEAYVADGVAAVNVLAGGDGEARKMAVAGCNSVSVVNHDGATVAAEEVGEGHGAVRGSNHRGAHVGGNIYAGVESAFSIKWIDALAEGAGDLAFDRPEIWSCIGASPVCGRGVLGESERNANAGGAAQGCALQCVKLIERRIDLRRLNLLG